MARSLNLELRKLVLHYYLIGHNTRMIVDRIAAQTGRRYSMSYIRKLIWQMRKEGLLAKPPSSGLWGELEVWIRSSKTHAYSALEAVKAGDLKTATVELEAVLERLERAQNTYKALYLGYTGVRVMR
ncbi:MAG: hypothetical protein ABWK01_07915 [Infirmifilum sp.]